MVVESAAGAANVARARGGVGGVEAALVAVLVVPRPSLHRSEKFDGEGALDRVVAIERTTATHARPQPRTHARTHARTQTRTGRSMDSSRII